MTKPNSENLNWSRIFSEADGTLGVSEFAAFPFVPKRFFWLTGVGKDAIRADHAHRTCHQILICLAGSLNVTITSLKNQVESKSMTIGTTIHLSPLQWLELSEFSPDAVLGVLASEPYDQDEYITDRSVFFGLNK